MQACRVEREIKMVYDEQKITICEFSFLFYLEYKDPSFFQKEMHLITDILQKFTLLTLLPEDGQQGQDQQGD